MSSINLPTNHSYYRHANDTDEGDKERNAAIIAVVTVVNLVFIALVACSGLESPSSVTFGPRFGPSRRRFVFVCVALARAFSAVRSRIFPAPTARSPPSVVTFAPTAASDAGYTGAAPDIAGGRRRHAGGSARPLRLRRGRCLHAVRVIAIAARCSLFTAPASSQSAASPRFTGAHPRDSGAYWRGYCTRPYLHLRRLEWHRASLRRCRFWLQRRNLL